MSENDVASIQVFFHVVLYHINCIINKRKINLKLTLIWHLMSSILWLCVIGDKWGKTLNQFLP